MQKNSELVRYLNFKGVLNTQSIIQAFLAVDRKHFIQPDYRDDFYIDAPIPIGYGQTNSQPTTVAMMLEWLQAQPGNKILDIGSGSGWTTALLAHLVEEKGSVIGLEFVPELVKFGQANLAKFDFPNAKIEKAGKKLGLPGQKFDRILVSATATSLPEELLEQLEIGGILVAPVLSSIFVIEKISENEYTETEHFGFSFVPLVE
ncbi:protein-L-isoaspartate O-methyltransferase [Candidatus Margulisiibacteriota bacterium]